MLCPETEAEVSGTGSDTDTLAGVYLVCNSSFSEDGRIKLWGSAVTYPEVVMERDADPPAILGSHNRAE